MAKAAPKKKAAAKKAAPKIAAAVKAAAPTKAAPKKKAASAKAPAKRPVGRPPGKQAAAPAKRPVGRSQGKKAAAAKTAGKRPAAKKAAAPAKRPVGRPPGKKAAAAKIAAKRPVGRPVGRPPGKKAATATSAAKRPVGGARGKKAAAAKTVARRRVAAPAARLQSIGGVQTFTVNHLNEADFKVDGLRPYARYRDLGIALATGGLCQAHVIRLIPPCTDEVRERHMHEAELQLIYVLKGWIKNEFEGHGPQMMSAGTCWLQPPGIKHTVLDYSADCEMLEIIVPADFKTAEVA
jgi:uncharacterized RmlC-like cupin family protein